MALIRFYQRHLSRQKPYPTCRFTPTCSQYALEAFEKRGFFAGLTLTLWRILRCSPLSPGGYDPVPAQGFHTMPLRWSKYDRPPGAETEPPEEHTSSGGETPSEEVCPDEGGAGDGEADTGKSRDHSHTNDNQP
jgi:hypothetical protein